MHRITKAALGLMALPAAGLALAGPASASGTTQQTVALSGSAHLVDYDIGSDDLCDVTFLKNDTGQLPTDPMVNFHVVKTCDEARLTVNASGTLASDGSVSISGSVLLEDEDCFITCGYDQVGTRTFSRTLKPASTATVTGSIDDHSQSAASWTIALSNS
jgi:hypothetical protein